MIATLFVWMGSFLFWGIAVPIWIACWSIMVKLLFPDLYKWIISGQKSWKVTGEEIEYGTLMFFFFFTWPAVAVACLIWIIARYVIFNMIVRYIFKVVQFFLASIDKAIPNIKIERK